MPIPVKGAVILAVIPLPIVLNFSEAFAACSATASKDLLSL